MTDQELQDCEDYRQKYLARLRWEEAQEGIDKLPEVEENDVDSLPSYVPEEGGDTAK